MKLKMTVELAYASGMDAGNRNMRKHGRDHWNIDDQQVAAEEINRLLDMVEGYPKAPPAEQPLG